MKKRMFSNKALFVGVCLVVMGWSTAHARSLKFVTGLDYFFDKDAYKEFKQDVVGGVDYYEDDGADASANYEEKAGYGARLGFRVPIEPVSGLSWGLSAGYVKGPDANGTVDYDYTPIALNLIGRETWKQETHFYRFLLEGEKNFKLQEKLGFVVSLGAGWAMGKVESKVTDAGDDDGDLYEDRYAFSDNWKGFTWEVSPALRFDMGSTTLDVGLRYAQFPKYKGKTDDGMYWNYAVYPVDWSSLGMFVALGF